MQKLVWQNANGDEINLTGGNYGITEWEGFSNTSLNIQSQQVPFQDGAVYLDALLNQRDLSVTLKMQDNGNLEERYRMRRELIHILNPKLGEGYLIYTNDFISKRIKCVAQVPLFETHNSDTRGTPKASLAWTACEPYWEDLVETSVVFNSCDMKELVNVGDTQTQIQVEIRNIENSGFEVDNVTTHKKINCNESVTGNVTINTEIGKKSLDIESDTKFLTLYGGYFRGGTVVGNKIILCGECIAILNPLTNEIERIQINIDELLNDITYSSELDLYLAVSSTKVYSSNDLSSWTERTTGFQVQGTVISWEDNLFKTYALDNKVLISEDGVTWEKITGTINKDLQKSSFNNVYYRINSSKIQRSSDNINWVDVYSEKRMYFLISTSEILCAIGASAEIVKITTRSSDWSLVYSGYNFEHFINAFNKIYLYDSYSIYLLENNKIYTIHTFDKVVDVFFKDGIMLVLTKKNIYRTIDGNNFTSVYTLHFDAYNGNIFYNDTEDRFCVYYDGNVFVWSFNGIDWELYGFHNPLPYNRIDTPYMKYFNGNYYIACLAKKEDDYYYKCIMKSSDLENFDTVYIENTIALGNITGLYADDDFIVALCQDGIYIYSSNGTSFIKKTTSENKYLYNIKKHNGLYYITGIMGFYITTTDFNNQNDVSPFTQLGRDCAEIAFDENDNMYYIGGFFDLFADIYLGTYVSTGKINIINKLSAESDMSFNLIQGSNIIAFLSSVNAICTVKYRQKYIGV